MIGWFDCSAGVSGDMLLGALVDAGADLGVMQAAVDTIGVEPIRLSVAETTRHGLAASKVDVHTPQSTVTCTWANIRGLLESADLAELVRETAVDVFARLARAEAAVHRTSPEQVHFHEVGALDAIADVVGVAAGLHDLGLTSLSAGTVVVGTGMARGEHGLIPIPGPAVLALLSEAGAPTWAGPAPYEMATPTGAAVLASVVSAWGPLPPMVVSRVGSGAGRRDVPEVANLLRLVLGEPVAATGGGSSTELLIESNVDDMDPRVWPSVLTDLMAAGAADAWLTPILMKKGRPAYTISVLCRPELLDRLTAKLFAATTTIGVRVSEVTKRALDRQVTIVDVSGQPVSVKIARSGGQVTNVSVEYEDAARAADELGIPVKEVLRAASAVAHSSSPNDASMPPSA